MANRSEAVKREVEFSASFEEKAAPKVRYDDGWRVDHETELSKYFSGDYAADAGLRSGFGGALERQRDGVSFCVQGFAAPQPPRGIELGPGARSLDVGRVVDALRRIPELAAEAVVTMAVDKWKEKTGEKKVPDDVYMELLEGAADEARAAVETALRHLNVLAAYYSKFPVGAYIGLLGLEPYGMSAALTPPIVKATKAWMREKLEAELAHADSAAALSGQEAVERLDVWQKEREALQLRLERYEAEGEEKPAGETISVSKRATMVRKLAELDATIAAASTLTARIDVPAIVRAKWEREPTFDELRQTLRKANEDSKRLKSPELRDAAKKLVADALGAAKRDLGSARQAYAEARRAGRNDKCEQDVKSRDARVRARIKAFDERAAVK